MTRTSRLRRRAGLAAAAVTMAAAMITAVPAGAAEGSGSVTFEGAGWGHGIGLSQYGAYGMAKEGAVYDEILGHFFTGATVGTLGEGGLRAKDDPSNLWVNLEKDRDHISLKAWPIGYLPPQGDPVPVTITRGAETWEWQPYERAEVTAVGAECTLTITPQSGDPLVTDPGPCEFDFAWNGFDPYPTTKIEIEGCTQADWNQVPTAYPACMYGRGMLHVRSGPGGLDLSVEIDLDDYVRGISEMPYYWGTESNGGIEALKAQAVASRSYARELQLFRGAPGDNSCAAWCHVRDTTFDQRYVGWGHGGQYTDAWIEAVEATAGQVLTHPDAPTESIVRAYYSSSSGGMTENIWEVWNWPDERQYYSSVDDHWALDPTLNPNASWTATRTGAAVASAVGLDVVGFVQVQGRNSSGSVDEVVFRGLQGEDEVTVTKDASWVRSAFGLKSIYFDITTDLPGYPHATPPPPSFTDIDGSPHFTDIQWVAQEGISKGCNPPDNDRYCPADAVTRGQMAAFLGRALDLPATETDFFTDDEASIFEGDINRLAAAGITKGCGNGRFCPDDVVTRGQMAAFLVRALGYSDAGAGDWFVDDDGSIFEGDIDRLRVAGVTLGCNPPDNDRYCPDDPVRRDQMASFLARALRI